ncbi:helix-turn-helix transcriptional regulator [Aliidiomarina haloalkalitolerans]|uniref:Transcriptional regulator n=1 Tax=Aliidiomarina haloalkalitolerans TaxID=859059 RepID=A0A432VUT5_9GAMM|nr:helix-turn-helix transcriptional regulator [Aliidiomarina haloalkalitolerans]RUO20138.1 transcriptional regulator [Aliidiomarina haloalkalitolerans]
MRFRTAPVGAILAELGQRLKQARLNKNLTQEDVAKKVGVARRTVVEAEKGHARLETFVAILQVLGVAEQLENFLPEQDLSPLEILKLKGKKRQRASGQVDDSEDMEQW